MTGALHVSVWLSQIASVMRLELRKSFFARRGLWIYLLAFGPALLYLIHAIDVTRDHEHRQALLKSHPVDAAALRSIRPGMTDHDVEAILGEPYQKNEFHFGRRQTVAIKSYRYTDGESDFNFVFSDGTIPERGGINQQDRCNLQKDSAIFATVFQFFYLRLAVFFGCVGIFTNLFRGEMLDKSLHFYLLAPMRREVLLAGKYLAGLSAAVVIFTLGTAAQIAALSWHFEPGQVAAYMHGTGWSDIAAYLGVTALACAGYGSIFLAAGLVFRNPIFPATAVMLWESINLFLPGALKQISIIYYLQSLCPTVAAPESDINPLLRMLISTAEPPPAWLAVVGLMLVTLAVLAVAAMRARRLEINYGTE
jgi:ABC-type transport system involved in multi-copper enzyme maturation permease subunit